MNDKLVADIARVSEENAKFRSELEEVQAKLPELECARKQLKEQDTTIAGMAEEIAK